MLNQLKHGRSYKNTVATITVLAVIFGALCSVLGFFALPFAAAYYATLFVFSSSCKYARIVAAVSVAVPLIIGAFVSGMALFISVLALVTGAFIGFMYLLGRSKPETVAVTVFAAILTVLLALWIYAGTIGGDFSFGAVRDFYLDLYAGFKDYFIKYFKETTASLNANLSESDASDMLSSAELYLTNLAYNAPSLIGIFIFVITGISFKIFSAAVYRRCENTDYILRWRFSTSGVFVIFYILLAVLNIFISEINAYTLSVVNLYAFFNFIYAYIGYNYLTAIFAQKMRPGIARLIIILAVLFLSSFAMQVLALLGAFFTFLANKAMRNHSGDFNKTDNESENDNEKD